MNYTLHATNQWISSLWTCNFPDRTSLHDRINYDFEAPLEKISSPSYCTKLNLILLFKKLICACTIVFSIGVEIA